MADTNDTNDNSSNARDDHTVAASEQQPLPRVDYEMQRVLALIAARSRGEASNDAVEAAVTHLLQSTGRAVNPYAIGTPLPITTPVPIQQQQPLQTPPSPSQQVQQTVTETNKIVADEDDYDDDDDDDYKEEKDLKDSSSSRKRPRKNQKTLSKTPPSRRRRASADNDRIHNDNYDELLEQIPLGRQGAKMMTTFGDGSHPNPSVVAAALLGARHMLQVAIRDARAIRRKAKQHFDLAKIVTMTKKKTSLATHAATAAIDSTMLYRAMEGYDKLAFDVKCGFDIEQLRVLFPEEMNAYAKWNEMHSEYVASTAEERKQAALEASPKRGTLDQEQQQQHHPQEERVGHLQERVAQFDARTRMMKDDWYLKFAEMRRGSFLPPKIASQEEAVENNNNDDDDPNNSNSNAPNWENRPATSIRFLHWVGFDPRSALPPPGEQITHALAFLCYDFFGRIVEKAVFLRNSRRHPEVDSDALAKELDQGDQLDATDIELALNDPEIRSVPLYGGLDDEADAAHKPIVATQLYFGPGFEERLELEMEELLSGSKKKTMSEEERKIRVEEDTLFGKIKSPPGVDRVGGHLLEDS